MNILSQKRRGRFTLTESGERKACHLTEWHLQLQRTEVCYAAPEHISTEMNNIKCKEGKKPKTTARCNKKVFTHS